MNNRIETQIGFCNEIIHNELKENSDYIICPICNIQKINVFQPKKIDMCCDKQYLINDNGIVCINCGIKSGDNEYVMPYINFYENGFKFRKKTIYNRRYHIQNILFSYKIKQLTVKNQDKILMIFVLIDKVPKKENRKRMISIHYIIRCIFKLLKMDYKFIPLPKSKKTIIYYEKYWNNILRLRLIGDEIYDIIQK